MNREQRRKAAKQKGKGDRGIGGNNLPADRLSYALSLHQGGQLAEAEAEEGKNPEVATAKCSGVELSGGPEGAKGL